MDKPIQELREDAAVAEARVHACRAAVKRAEDELERARQLSLEADKALIEAETRAALGQPNPSSIGRK